jgi:hypothetical protein
LTITSGETSGLARQLRLMKLNRRCSIWGEMPMVESRFRA